jgi:hypothetical protein
LFFNQQTLLLPLDPPTWTTSANQPFEPVVLMVGFPMMDDQIILIEQPLLYNQHSQ